MKTLLSLLTLAVIVTLYILSANLYLQGSLVAAYTLVIGSIVSLIFWIRNVSAQLEDVSVKVPSIKALVRFMTLPAIAFIYVYSVSLYVQGNLIASYFLVLGSIVALIFWIENVSVQLQKQSA
jgi:hypothetical protein